MTPDEIPQELIDILDMRAGKVHSRTGIVVACLAEILTQWEVIRGHNDETTCGQGAQGTR